MIVCLIDISKTVPDISFSIILTLSPTSKGWENKMLILPNKLPKLSLAASPKIVVKIPTALNNVTESDLNISNFDKQSVTPKEKIITVFINSSYNSFLFINSSILYSTHHLTGM